jgi:quercetin dioxygenase-like cupin family protein
MDTIVRHRDEGPSTWFLNSLVTRKVAAVETGGAYGVTEHLLTAASNPPPHRHFDEEEAFYVLDGELELTVDEATAACRAGTFALVPRGALHSFRVTSETVRMLVFASAPGVPGGPANGGFERFFEAAGTPAAAPVLPTPQAPDPAVLTMLAARHGIEILPPA